MAHTVCRDGPIAGLAFTGRISVDEVIDAIRDLAAIDPDADTIGVVVDLTGLDDWHVDVEDLHRISATIRSRFGRGPLYRAAVVSEEDRIETLVRDYVDVRDLLTAPRAELPPRMQLFATVAEARSWIEEAGAA